MITESNVHCHFHLSHIPFSNYSAVIDGCKHLAFCNTSAPLMRPSLCVGGGGSRGESRLWTELLGPELYWASDPDKEGRGWCCFRHWAYMQVSAASERDVQILKFWVRIYPYHRLSFKIRFKIRNSMQSWICSPSASTLLWLFTTLWISSSHLRPMV